jgi:hypothetical protein
MSTFVPRSVWVILSSLFLTVALVSAQSYTYQTFDVALSGAYETKILGLSDAGTMAGMYNVPDANRDPVYKPWFKYWNKAAIKVVQPGYQLTLHDANGNGQMVGGYSKSKGGHGAFYKKESTFWPILGPHSEPGRTCAISQKDTRLGSAVVACSYVDTALDAPGIFFWDPKTRVVLGTIPVLNVDEFMVLGMNNRRDVTGMLRLAGVPGPDEHGVRDPNDHEWGFVGWADPAAHGGQALELVDANCARDSIEFNHTWVQDINDASLMAVTCRVDEFDWETVIFSYTYDGVTWTPITAPGFPLDTRVRRITNNGMLAGEYWDSNTYTVHGFIAKPVQAVVAQ